MTRQFVEDAVTMIVVYDDGRPDDFFSGYLLNYSYFDWDHIVDVYPSKIQAGSSKLQKLVNEFLDQELTWEQYLDELVKSGKLQDIPKTFCY